MGRLTGGRVFENCGYCGPRSAGATISCVNHQKSPNIWVRFIRESDFSGMLARDTIYSDSGIAQTQHISKLRFQTLWREIRKAELWRLRSGRDAIIRFGFCCTLAGAQQMCYTDRYGKAGSAACGSR